ncbi:GNAT family N-acetyltransferase [Rhabdothermincola sediminis]|uniref:GNAT family N-acetyltransferase n=1 Tax=Rhabdothermincola sediminis TaxID=2751370 RepID=UPI001AA0613B|nr:GNAT family N-acetyltransferase [Rhabdothermincola sediminis]
MEEARPADATDIGTIAALVRQAVAELRPQRGGDLWASRVARAEPVDDQLAAALADADHEVLVGMIDGTTVGYAVAHTERLRDGRLLGVVDDVYVEPDARGVGVGEALMDRLLEWATERGCSGLDAMVLPGNRAAKNFFERFGLTARAIVVHRSLAPEDG